MVLAKHLQENAPFLNSILSAKHCKDRKLILHAARHNQLLLLFSIARATLSKKNGHLFKPSDRKKLEACQADLKTFITKSSQLRKGKK